jgi:DNA-binding NarL/FixJ family response regulator
MLSCLIVDDSPAFVQAARNLLERQGVTVVGAASSSDEALQQADALRPDVTLVDIDLGGQSGFDVVRRLRGEADQPLSRMILVSTHSEEDYADLIAASPAEGFLPKSDLSADAIRNVLGPHDDDPCDPLDGPPGR